MKSGENCPAPLDDQLCYAVYSAGMAIQRAYKPLLDSLGLTYPQYLVLNVLWEADGVTVGSIADRLALEPSTLTPLLKRLESAGLVQRTRNPENERQVLIALTHAGREIQNRAGCLGEKLIELAARTPQELGMLNVQMRALRDTIYAGIGAWTTQHTPHTTDPLMRFPHNEQD